MARDTKKDKTTMEEIRKFFDTEEEQKKDGLKMPEQQVCSHCGRCPVCGEPRAPYLPEPYPYWHPYWTGSSPYPYTISSDSGDSGS